MTLKQRFRIFLGITYRCRCGAFVPTASRAIHEELHDALREFCSGPTPEEWAAFQKAAPPEKASI